MVDIYVYSLAINNVGLQSLSTGKIWPCVIVIFHFIMMVFLPHYNCGFMILDNPILYRPKPQGSWGQDKVGPNLLPTGKPHEMCYLRSLLITIMLLHFKSSTTSLFILWQLVQANNKGPIKAPHHIVSGIHLSLGWEILLILGQLDGNFFMSWCHQGHHGC